MAQASGLNNVIRQVGGSFGVAILSTVLTSRVIYHSQIFGESLQSNSPIFQSTLQGIGGWVGSATGATGSVADSQSQYILMSHISKQAYIEGINDDFLLAAIFTAISIIPILFLKSGKMKRAKGAPSAIPGE